METIHMKTEDLTGGALDWAVGKADGLEMSITPPNYGDGVALAFITGCDDLFRPSSNWALAGPLQEKHRINSGPLRNGNWTASPLRPNAPTTWMYSDSATVAICRAIVVDKIGLSVSVPRELVQ
jgi:hypothetical protein